MGKLKVPIAAEILGNAPSTVVRSAGRLVADMDRKILRLHDGETAGGHPIGGSSSISFVNLTDYMTTEEVEQSLSIPVPLSGLDPDEDVYDFADVSYAFQAAINEAKYIWVPPGMYRLGNIRPHYGTTLLCAGSGATGFVQAEADEPIFNVLSDEDVGQLLYVTIKDFIAFGHPEATVPIVQVTAEGVYALTRCDIGPYFVQGAYAAFALGSLPDNFSTFYNCTLDVTSNKTAGKAVLMVGGPYNDVKVFATQCEDYSFYCYGNGGNMNIIGDNCMHFGCQASRINATVEHIWSEVAPSQVVIKDAGFNNNFYAPMVNLNNDAAAKITYAYEPFSKSLFIDPQILGNIAHPFSGSNYTFTVVNGRAGSIENKMEEIYNGVDFDLTNCTFVGDCSDLTDVPTTPGIEVIQRYSPATMDDATPSAPFNFIIDPATTSVMLTPTIFISLVNFSFVDPNKVPSNGKKIKFKTTYAIKEINWDEVFQPAWYALLPDRLSENGSFTIVWDGEAELWRVLDLIDNGLTNTAVYNPASLVDGAGVTTTVTVVGAALGNLATASFSLDLQGITLTAWVSAADTVSVRFQNESGGTIDLASGTIFTHVHPFANSVFPSTF